MCPKKRTLSSGFYTAWESRLRPAGRQYCSLRMCKRPSRVDSPTRTRMHAENTLRSLSTMKLKWSSKPDPRVRNIHSDIWLGQPAVAETWIKSQSEPPGWKDREFVCLPHLSSHCELHNRSGERDERIDWCDGKEHIHHLDVFLQLKIDFWSLERQFRRYSHTFLQALLHR